MIVPNSNFRPNPVRAVYVQGNIDEQLVYRHTARILQLQSQSRDPITVYIDSRGGNLSHMESLWRLLTASNQDSAPPCRIITVVTSRAASAAADLLSSGDYAIAMPQSTILYHGSRTFRETPLTVETASLIGELLRLTNETYAMELIRKIESRFMFRFLLSKSQFEEIRKKNPGKKMTDTECFLEVISGSLSDRAKKLFGTAKQRHGRYDKLLKTVPGKKASKGKNTAEIEAARLRAIIDFELRENRTVKNWTFQDGGLTRLTDDFYLLTERLALSQVDRLNRLCTQWGKFSLTKEDQEEIDQAPESQREELLIRKVRPHLEPLWAFFVALCHALQEGENELTATDAFWLGLIDEVMGAPPHELPCLRFVIEYKEDPPAEAAPGAAAPTASD